MWAFVADIAAPLVSFLFLTRAVLGRGRAQARRALALLTLARVAIGLAGGAAGLAVAGLVTGQGFVGFLGANPIGALLAYAAGGLLLAPAREPIRRRRKAILAAAMGEELASRFEPLRERNAPDGDVIDVEARVVREHPPD